MPCYQVNTISLDFMAADLTLLQKAAAALGLKIGLLGSDLCLWRNGTELPIATLRDNKAVCSTANVATINKLRVQYSREVVNHAALKLGWQKTMKTDNKFLLRKGV
jgi:hypothetical protein